MFDLGESVKSVPRPGASGLQRPGLRGIGFGTSGGARADPQANEYVLGLRGRIRIRVDIRRASS